MSFIIRNKTAGAIAINDMGLTIPAGVGSPPIFDYDLTPEKPQDVATSNDLVTQIQAGNLVVLDPLDGLSELSAADSQTVVEVHNDPHWRIRGATLNQLDDVDTTGAVQFDVLQLNGSGTYVAVTPDDLVGGATTAINQAIANLFTNGTDTTVVTTGSPLTAIQIDVDDVFLRNTGDTLDSGTLNIASGATLAVLTGGDLTIADAPVNPTDAVNKAYVDSVAAGLDPKESVRVATTADVGGVFTAGSPAGPGDAIAGASAVIDDITLVALDRVLVKDQTDPKQNGIYVVNAVNAGSPATVDLVRADDQDGTPANEVSAGNFTFVEVGTINASTGWVVAGDGILTLDTDNIVWVQFSESSTYSAGAGLGLTGSQFYLDLNNLTGATIALADEIAFNDVTDSNTTRNTTVQDMLNTLNIPYGLTGTGIVVQTADDTYTKRSVAAATADNLLGLAVTNGDGVAGNPTVGLDLTSLPYITAGSPAGTIALTDRVPVYDVDLGRNVYYQVQDIAGAVATTNSFVTWQATGGSDTGGPVVADSSTDTATLIGGTGIALALNAGADSFTFNLSFAQIPAGGSPSVVDLTDEIILNNGGTIVKVTMQDVVDTLGLSIDQLVKVSANDTTPGYLDGKLVAGTYTTLTQNNDGGNETLTVDVNLSAINLGDLGDVNLTGSPALATGDILIYNAGSPAGWTHVPSSSLTFDVCNLTAGTVGTLETTDSIAVCDAGSTVRFTFAEVFNTLNVPYGLTGTGFVVQTADDTYTKRSIAVAGVGLGDGLAITNGDGVAGNPTLELDIDGTPAAGENLAATDEVIANNASASANQKFTGQEVADGVATMLGLSSLTIKAIGGSGSPGEQQLFMTDPTRSKDLSVAEFTVSWSETTVGNNDWLEFGGASDATSGYIMPHDATIVRATAQSANAPSSKGIDLYVDGVATAPLITVPSGADTEVSNGTLNVDVNATQKIRLRGASTGGTIQDTIITLWLRWR